MTRKNPTYFFRKSELSYQSKLGYQNKMSHINSNPNFILNFLGHQTRNKKQSSNLISQLGTF
jgi:hypothetical protein